MELLRRVAELIWCGPFGAAAGDAPVVLRHAPSGLVLSHGIGDASEPVQFADRATAENFQRRFLDEVDAWEAVAPRAERQAA
jgi:hypothetical protein